MASDNITPLGRWAGTGFESTAAEYAGAAADADLPDDTRFVSGVAQLVRKQLANPPNEEGLDDLGLAIFVLTPQPPASLTNAARVPMVNNGLTGLSGRLWFTPPAVVSAHYVELSRDKDDDGLFNYVASELGLGERPTLVLERRTPTPELRWYPNGLSTPDDVEIKTLSGSMTANEVFSAIDLAYRECFATPSGLNQQANLWADARRHRPLRNAETLLQSLLKVGLTMKFPHCRIWHEQPQIAGRTDLEIVELEPSNPAHSIRHGIIELKVLRSYWSTGGVVPDSQTGKWVREGVKQAAAYRNEKPSQWTALCCFDMRSTDIGETVCFASVQELATRLDVLLKRWFLYSDYDAYRQATVGL